MATIYGLQHGDPVRSIAGADAIVAGTAALPAAATVKDAVSGRT